MWHGGAIHNIPVKHKVESSSFRGRTVRPSVLDSIESWALSFSLDVVPGAERVALIVSRNHFCYTIFS